MFWGKMSKMAENFATDVAKDVEKKYAEEQLESNSVESDKRVY